ncbi:MAG TPA: TIGR03620 family F420-dependent LLM class oxidoreductase [Acidimicrobiales bacterium]|nr:TIGR03620 family F420-dependent LLM class oxidoreductase [Acidimicrobiales bacterium]
MDLGRVGIWWSGSWRVDGTDAAAEVEELGYRTLWLSNGFDERLSDRFGRLLSATKTAVVASGIVSIWHTPAASVATDVSRVEQGRRQRLLLGLGVSHAPLVDAIGQRYERPYEHMVRYLDGLDDLAATAPGAGADRRVLAALGPRMLRLAAERTLGAHPYFVPVAHTARAREILGSGPLLAPELAVVLEDDRTAARQVARRYTEGYLQLPNYANNLRSLGYGDDDLAGAGSDRLVDDVVASGDLDAIAARVRAHHEAGADHVCLQVVADLARGFPIDAYRRLAPAVT